MDYFDRVHVEESYDLLPHKVYSDISILYRPNRKFHLFDFAQILYKRRFGCPDYIPRFAWS